MTKAAASAREEKTEMRARARERERERATLVFIPFIFLISCGLASLWKTRKRKRMKKTFYKESSPHSVPKALSPASPRPGTMYPLSSSSASIIPA